MESIDFYKLPRATQERFVGSVNGSGLPAPIVRADARLRAPAGWRLVAGASLAVLVAGSRVGYGDVTSAAAEQSAFWLALYVGLTSLTAFGLLRAAALVREHRASPFRRGLYVFPVGLIDARRAVLRLHPIEDLTEVVGPDARGLTLTFGGQAFAFPVHDVAVSEVARASIRGARDAMGQAGSARESVRPKALAALDPLQGYANPLASASPMAPADTPRVTFSAAMAVLLGVALGSASWMVRNARSDDALFARASVANDTAAYLAYLGKGSRHAFEVSSRLLPEAQLRDAEATGTVDALVAFLEQHPHSKVSNEASQALLGALRSELEVAEHAGTLAALDEFSRRRPGAPLVAELAAARHAVFKAALDHYLAGVSDNSSESARFVRRLVAWSETKGPRVDIRFRTRRSKTLDKADGAVGKSRQFKGAVSLPSRYFDEGAEQGDRDALAAAIERRFGDVFSKEILAPTLGATVADSDAALPTPITAPTLFIEPGAVWAGSLETSPKPRGVFVGLELTFEALFRMPDDAKGLRVKLEGWHVADLSVARDSDNPEEAVYAAMRAQAFEQFQKKLFSVLLPPAP